jgi:hypothetical protein
VERVSAGIACNAAGDTLLAQDNSLLTGVGNWLLKCCTVALFREVSRLQAVKSPDFAAKFPLAGNLVGDGCDRHCVASHAVGPSGTSSQELQKRPQTAGFRTFDSGLHAPISPFSAVELPKVSGPPVKYSRFKETIAGDLVRSRLPPTLRFEVSISGVHSRLMATGLLSVAGSAALVHPPPRSMKSLRAREMPT